jgi:hypothetical protein
VVVTDPAYCREIEAYLCRKNDGHLMRVVGPSFDLVSSWAERGVPLKIAFQGIDRCFERYYKQARRRRPVKIDFCDADVLDVFDKWRRAVGAIAVAASVGDDVSGTGGGTTRHQSSLPVHLERVVRRLTQARVGGALGAEFDALIDQVAIELDAARAKAGGLRGEARRALCDRLAALDADLLAQARAILDQSTRADLEREADEDLAQFRTGMTGATFAAARTAAIDRLVRVRFNLPMVTFEA